MFIVETRIFRYRFMREKNGNTLLLLRRRLLQEGYKQTGTVYPSGVQNVDADAEIFGIAEDLNGKAVTYILVTFGEGAEFRHGE